MEQIKKIAFCIPVLLVLAFVFFGCPNTPSSGSGAITWSLDHNGEIDVSRNPIVETDVIIIRFSSNVPDILDSHINITGAAQRNIIEEFYWEDNDLIVPVTVSASEMASVTITKSGIVAGSKSVMVYKIGQKVPIDWSAVVNGSANSVSTTEITFTFSAEVEDLLLSDIIITQGTGLILIGDLTEENGTTWVLDISVINQGSLTIKFNHSDIVAAERTFQVHKKPENPVNDKTTYIDDVKMVFSASIGNNGTYNVYTPRLDEDENPVLLSGKYQWELSETGNYAWNQNALTITITPQTFIYEYDDGTRSAPMNKSQMQTFYVNLLNAEIDEMWEYAKLFDPTTKRKDIEDLIIDMTVWIMDLSGNIRTVAQLAAAMTNEAFASRALSYSSNNDGSALFLYHPLPAPKGTDQLNGKTFSVFLSDEEYNFSANRTYTYTESIYYAEEGSYSYESSPQKVYFQPLTIDGQTRAQYYEEMSISLNHFESDAAYRTAMTNAVFYIDHKYDYYFYVLQEMEIYHRLFGMFSFSQPLMNTVSGIGDGSISSSLPSMDIPSIVKKFTPRKMNSRTSQPGLR